MHKHFFASLVLFATTAFASENCRLNPEIIQENLALDWQTFDQSLGQGHRALGLRGCNLEAGALIDIYTLQHQNHLEPYRVRILKFHAGQYYGYAELNGIAAARMTEAFNPSEELKPELNWNDYVQASVAFMRGDLPALRLFRDKLQSGRPTEGNQMNLRVVNNLVRCFGKPYAWAYERPEHCDNSPSSVD